MLQLYKSIKVKYVDFQLQKIIWLRVEMIIELLYGI